MKLWKGKNIDKDDYQFEQIAGKDGIINKEDWTKYVDANGKKYETDQCTGGQPLIEDPLTTKPWIKTTKPWYECCSDKEEYDPKNLQPFKPCYLC